MKRFRLSISDIQESQPQSYRTLEPAFMPVGLPSQASGTDWAAEQPHFFNGGDPVNEVQTPWLDPLGALDFANFAQAGSSDSAMGPAFF
jgi:hypothetical protein